MKIYLLLISTILIFCWAIGLWKFQVSEKIHVLLALALLTFYVSLTSSQAARPH